MNSEVQISTDKYVFFAAVNQISGGFCLLPTVFVPLNVTRKYIVTKIVRGIILLLMLCNCIRNIPTERFAVIINLIFMRVDSDQGNAELRCCEGFVKCSRLFRYQQSCVQSHNIPLYSILTEMLGHMIIANFSEASGNLIDGSIKRI